MADIIEDSARFRPLNYADPSITRIGDLNFNHARDVIKLASNRQHSKLAHLPVVKNVILTIEAFLQTSGPGKVPIGARLSHGRALSALERFRVPAGNHRGRTVPVPQEAESW